MTYSQFARSFMIIPQLLMIVLMPVFGRLMDRLNPVRISAIAFCFLTFWPLILGFATQTWHAYAAFAFFGLGMSAVQVTWNLGALYFAPAREAQKYHSAHVTLVGLRACFAPWLAVLLFLPLVGFRVTFFMAAGFFAVASVCMALLHLRSHRAADSSRAP
jgi:MFS family permease